MVISMMGMLNVYVVWNGDLDARQDFIHQLDALILVLHLTNLERLDPRGHDCIDRDQDYHN